MHVGKSPILVWVVLLFFGFPLVGELLIWLSFVFFDSTWDQSGASLWTLTYGLLLIPFVLHSVSYLFVRRLKHRILFHLWLYAIIAGAIAIVSRLAVAPFDLDTPDMFGWVMGISAAIFAASLIVLVWFARRESAISFRHSLLFIGLVVAIESPGTFIPLNFLYPSEVSAPYSSVFVALAAVHVIVKVAGVWSLVNHTVLTSSARNLLTVVSLFILLAGLQLVSVVFNDPYVDGMSLLFNMASGIGQWVVQYGIAIAIVYVVRVRKPADGKSTPVNVPAYPERA